MKSTVGALVAAIVLLACGGGDDESGPSTTTQAAAATTMAATTTAPLSAASTSAPSTAPPSTAAALTTEAPTTEAPATTAAPTTTVDPQQRALDRLVNHFEMSDPRGLKLMAPGSPAYVYFEGLVLLNDFSPNPAGPASVTRTKSGMVITSQSPALRFTDFRFDASGLITDFSRNGEPFSRSVIALGSVFEAGGLRTTLHSARRFDGVVQVLAVTINAGGVENGSSYLSTYVVGGRQLNVSSSSGGGDVFPGATIAVLTGFDGAELGGEVRGQVGSYTDSSSDYADIIAPVPAP